MSAGAQRRAPHAPQLAVFTGCHSFVRMAITEVLGDTLTVLSYCIGDGPPAFCHFSSIYFTSHRAQDEQLMGKSGDVFDAEAIFHCA